MKSGSKGYQIILMNDATYQIPIDQSKHTIYLRPLADRFLFEPKEYKLTPQQLKEHCNADKEKKSFDFTLKGLLIESKAMTKKTSMPLKNIKVSITSQNQQEKFLSTTDQHGIFTFSEIMPETYVMKIEQESDSKIKWERSEITCQASVPKQQRAHQECSEVVLIATGFSVSGAISVKNGNRLHDVEVKLSPKDSSKQKEYCLNNSCVARSNENVNKQPLMLIQQGQFQFTGVEQGEFIVKPVKADYMGKFQPKMVQIAVHFQPVTLKEDIRLTHISNYHAAIESEIDPNSTKITLLKTSENKSTTLKFQENSKNIKFPNLEVNEVYKLSVQSPHYRFDQSEIFIQSPNEVQSKTLNISATSIEVCGEIKMMNLSDKRVIKFFYQSNGHSQFKTVVADKEGKFCDYLSPNKYQILTALTELDKQKGIVFHPNKFNIDLKQKPILNLKFKQASIKVIGVVAGFHAANKKVPNIQLSLVSLQDNQEPSTLKSVEIPQKDDNSNENLLQIRFEFQNVGVGRYSVRVDSSTYCYFKDEIEVVVTGEAAQVELTEQFQMKGYNLNYRATYPIQEAELFRKDNKIEPMKGILIQKGKSFFCLPFEGEYFIKIPDCYRMKKLPNLIPFQVPIDSLGSNLQELALEAELFGVSGSVYIKDFPAQNSNEQIEAMLKKIDKIIGIKVKDNAQIVSLAKDQSSQELKYNYQIHLEYGRKTELSMTLLNDFSIEQFRFYRHLLIKPDFLPITISENCKVYQDFFVNLGVIVHGKTIPNLEQVKITMIDTFTQQVIQTVTTNKYGKYSFDSIDPSTKTELTAEFDGYVLSDVIQGQYTVDIMMKKLSELYLYIIDGDSQQPISGVKLLLSSQTSNNQNQHNNDIKQIETGVYKFNKIKSGKNQRLQVMLREYQFDNGGIFELQIEDEETKKTTIYGHRVTFSAYGVVMKGDQKKVKNVLIRAKCLDKSQCQDFVHESVTNKQGKFRIEELKPQAAYELRVVIISQKGDDNEIDQNQYEEKIETKIQKCEPQKI